MQYLQCTTQHSTTPPEIPARMIVHIMRNMKAAQAGISVCGTKGGRQRPGNSLGAAEGNTTRGGQECFEVGRKILMDFDAGRTGTPTLRKVPKGWISPKQCTLSAIFNLWIIGECISACTHGTLPNNQCKVAREPPCVGAK